MPAQGGSARSLLLPWRTRTEDDVDLGSQSTEHEPGEPGDAGELVLVVAGGPLPHALPPLAPGTTVIAADSGVEAVLAAGLVPTVVVGDLDSADPAAVAA